VVPSCRSAGRVADAGLGVGVGHADLGFEAVGVTEEEAEDGTEVRNESVRRARGHESVARGLERGEVVGLERDVVDATPAHHGCLSVGFGVALDLEQVDLGMGPDLDEGQPALGHLDLTIDLGAEDVSVEGDKSLGVVGEDRDMVEPIEQHTRSLPC
jgi:hypothetical protein